MLFLLAFTSADIIFHKILELHSTICEKKDFCHKFSFFWRIHSIPHPHPLNSQNPLSATKVFCQCSLFHMKITASVTKSSHQYHDPCYIHSPIFFLIHTLFSSAAVVTAVFLSKLDHRPLFNYIYYETILERIGFNMTNKRHTLLLPIAPC